MKTSLSLLAAVALVTSVGCKKSQTVEGPMDDPVSESAVATGGDLVEVIDIDPDLDDGYAHDVIEDVAPSSSADRYEVRRGDTLWSIATNVYGDGKRWPEIAQANQIGRASCRERGEISVVAVSLKKKKTLQYT